jgi:AcrR family transcriptional regulator
MRTVDIKKEEQTREEIIRVAQNLFQKYGLDKTTMEDIADGLGKGKSTLYHYFKSKEKIFLTVIRKEIQEVSAKVNSAIKEKSSPSEQLRSILSVRYYETKSKMLLYLIIISESKKHLDLFQKIQCEINITEIELLKKVLMEGIIQKEFKSIKQKDCNALALLAMSMSRGIHTDIILSGKLPSEDIKIETVIEVFVRGIV